MASELSKKYVLAVDHGTSGVKTSLMSLSGDLVRFENESTPITFLPGGGAEQDPELWWRALLSTAKKLVASKAVPVGDIVAICCSSTFSSTVAVDANGMHIGPSLTWMDSRGAPYVKKIVSGFPSVAGYNVITTLPWVIKTGGGPALSGKDDIAHVLLWKNEFPDVYEKARMFMGSKDYLNARLTGELAASYDSMALFWVTDTRDVDNIKYDDGLIAKLGISKDKLQPMRQSASILGEIKPEVADEIGLKRSVVVVCGSPDHQSACVGSGAIRDYEGHLYIGTSSWILSVVPFKKTDVLHSIASLPFSIPGKYYSANEQDVAGGVLPFLLDNVIYHTNRMGGRSKPADVYERLDEIAASVSPGAEGVIFTPWLNGERTPVDDTSIRAGIHNLSMRNNLDHIIRAAMEGVAFNTRWSLGYVEKFVGKKFDALNLIGGGARSKTWRRILADVLGRTIRCVKDPLQANARGAALIAGVALGHIKWDDVPDLVRIEEVVEPNPANADLYENLYGEFLNIFAKNRAIHARLNAGRKER